MPDFLESRPLLMDLSHFISNKALDRDVQDAAEILTSWLRNLRLA